MAQREVTATELLDAVIAREVARLSEPHSWIYLKRIFPDGRMLHLLQTMTGRRLGVSAHVRETGYTDIYDYADVDAAWRAALGWDGQGDPEGWVRAWKAGEPDARRRPDGTPESEYRAP